MRDNIVRAAKILAGRARVHNAHYLDTLKDADSRDVIYLDPPYQGTSGDRDSRYVKGMSFDEFCDGLYQLVQRDLSLVISYDGRIGDKVYGQRLPAALKLRLFEVKAGRSTQETLLGRAGVTYESLYVSESLLSRVPRLPRLLLQPANTPEQLQFV
jgi:DNA adenine methylase